MPGKIKGYFWTHGLMMRIINTMQNVHQGIWLGLLDDRTLQTITDRYYHDCLKLYEGREHNLSGLWPWETALLDRFFSACHSVLVGAAGAGRELVALTRRGTIVDGFECNGELVESGRRLLTTSGIKASLQLSEPNSVPSGLGTYDGIVIGWGAYMHIPGRCARVRLLTKLHQHIRPGGPILVSFLTRSSDSHKMREIYRIARIIRVVRRAVDQVELGDNFHGAFNHWFTREEIADELAEAGFEMEYFEDVPFGRAVGIALKPAGKVSRNTSTAAASNTDVV